MKRLTLTGSCVTEVLRCCCLLIMLLIQLGEGQEPSDLPSNGRNMSLNLCYVSYFQVSDCFYLIMTG